MVPFGMREVDGSTSWGLAVSEMQPEADEPRQNTTSEDADVLKT